MASSEQETFELNLGHPIFISHSGENKTFARHLYKELRNRWYHPFLDARSLPKAKEVSMHNILIEARSCKLALLVLTPDFFTVTRNPMLEVMAFVDSDVDMLPLFYKLTVYEVKRNEDRYKRKWIELNTRSNYDGPQCPDINAWSKAFKKITTFNGIEYGKNSTNEADFIEEVVDNVQKILPPNKLRDVRHIVGKERLVKVVEDMFKDVPYSGTGIKVLGLHGMEGTGKTTLCLALCNSYFSEFKHRVCHVQLHEGSPRDRIDSILLQLGSRNDGYSQRTDIEAQEQLELTLSASKFFMVIDDIQDSSASDKDEVGSLILRSLEHIPSGSKLLFLALRPSILRNVFSLIPEGRNIHIHLFPSLSLDEAKLILCREIPSLLPEKGLNDQQQIYFLNQCTELCTPKRGSNIYNPLMLKLLASFLVEKWASVKGSGQGMPNFEEFSRHLSFLKGDRSRGMQEFFNKLQTRFNTLMKEDQELFLDLALFVPREDVVSKQVCLRRDRRVVKDIFEKLRHAAFLSDDYGMLDVYKELAKMISKESPERFYRERRGLKGADLLQLVKKTWTRVAFVDCTFQMRKADLDLSRCAKIQILLLDGNKGLSSVITPSGTLQSIEIRSITPVLVKNGEIPSSHSCFSEFKLLAILELGGTKTGCWSLDTATLSLCEVLEIVHFYNINLQMDTWELPCWPYLKELKLSRVSSLEVLLGLEQLSILKKLRLSQLEALTSLSDVQSLGKLTTFVLGECNRVSELRLPGSLQHCTIERCDTLSKIDFRGDVMDTSEVTEAESSDDEWVASKKRITIMDCWKLEEISGLQEEGQPLSYQGFDFRCFNWGELGRISYIEFRKGAHSWYAHGLGLDEVRRGRFVHEVLGNGDGLKSLKLVCAKSGYCGCEAKSPSFHLLRDLECLEYHCSQVKDLSPIRECSNLRILRLDGCTSVVEFDNFSDILPLSEYRGPESRGLQCRPLVEGL